MFNDIYADNVLQKWANCFLLFYFGYSRGPGRAKAQKQVESVNTCPLSYMTLIYRLMVTIRGRHGLFRELNQNELNCLLSLN